MSETCYSGPIYANMKCIVISLVLAAGYWFAPPKNKWVLLGILYFTYLAIAWYDEYLCSKPFGPTYLKFFYDWAKPSSSMQSVKYDNLCPNIESQILTIDLVIILIGIILAPRFLRWNPK
jgi:hypothetical protein